MSLTQCCLTIRVCQPISCNTSCPHSDVSDCGYISDAGGPEGYRYATEVIMRSRYLGFQSHLESEDMTQKFRIQCYIGGTINQPVFCNTTLLV